MLQIHHIPVNTGDHHLLKLLGLSLEGKDLEGLSLPSWAANSRALLSFRKSRRWCVRALHSLAGLKSLKYDYIFSAKLHLGLPWDPKWLKQFFHQLRYYPSDRIGTHLRFYFAYPFIKLCLLMFQIRGYSPVPASPLPAPDLPVSLCHRILPLEGGSEGRGAPTLFHTCLKPPSHQGCSTGSLLSFTPLRWSCHYLLQPGPGCPTVRASPSSQGLFSQATLPGA